MKDARLICSMSKKGCSPDNSACEGFFGRLKNEMFYGLSWQDASIDEFIKILDEAEKVFSSFDTTTVGVKKFTIKNNNGCEMTFLLDSAFSTSSYETPVDTILDIQVTNMGKMVFHVGANASFDGLQRFNHIYM